MGSARFGGLNVLRTMEKQMEKSFHNEMETGLVCGVWSRRDF